MQPLLLFAAQPQPPHALPFAESSHAILSCYVKFTGVSGRESMCTPPSLPSQAHVECSGSLTVLLQLRRRNGSRPQPSGAIPAHACPALTPVVGASLPLPPAHAAASGRAAAQPLPPPLPQERNRGALQVRSPAHSCSLFMTRRSPPVSLKTAGRCLPAQSPPRRWRWWTRASIARCSRRRGTACAALALNAN